MNPTHLTKAQAAQARASFADHLYPVLSDAERVTLLRVALQGVNELALIQANASDSPTWRKCVALIGSVLEETRP